MQTLINFVNMSDSNNPPDVVIYQENLVTDAKSLAIAWQVIHQCPNGFYHPFVYETQLQVAVVDYYGNRSRLRNAENGDLFSVGKGANGIVVFDRCGKGTAGEIQVRNDLGQGSMTAQVFRDEQLLCCKTSIAPGQKAVFQFEPVIWVGTASQVTVGQPISSAVISDTNTQFNLLGIAKADLVMTGGGNSSEANPFNFQLEQVVMA